MPNEVQTSDDVKPPDGAVKVQPLVLLGALGVLFAPANLTKYIALQPCRILTSLSLFFLIPLVLRFIWDISPWPTKVPWRQAYSRATSSRLFWVFPLFLAFGVAWMTHLTLAESLKQKDKAQIVNLITSEPSFVGSNKITQVQQAFSPYACYVAQGAAFPSDYKRIEDDYKRYGGDYKRYAKIAYDNLDFERHDYEYGRSNIVARYQGKFKQGIKPVSGNGLVYKQEISDQDVFVDSASNVAYAMSQTLSRDTTARGGVFHGSPNRNDRVVWVFIRANSDADWEIFETHGGLTEEQQGEEYGALQDSMKKGKYPFQRPGHIKLLKVDAPKPPSSSDITAWQSWLKHHRDKSGASSGSNR